ncbi:prolipoprotein diacylglyceryl transferase [Pikeienuella piscinae]|uniref:Phosphatidylglycerol--prolipoprotein diacylglyceryl transferase n=1 Tax=Pikeienuella piscinae TaxID=2748098 RepID=A0A7L5BUU1_9RHOB|nr:prolipoprotein diacylglyceryl transferase [Pikeienuella piscinae]QIE55442.1 prolipoprotein diacylglyceryl transferase [Pikeienuella piscinae]
MPLVIPYPDIDPVLVTIELFGLSLPIRWYALAYLGGLLIGLALFRRLIARPSLWPGDVAPLNREQAESLLTWMVFGVILGGRLGFVLFYQPGHYLAHPGEILQVWSGGMSFHGGFLGVATALILFCRLHQAPLLQITDGVAAVAPVGLLLGRIANFINGELWGRTTEAPWGMVFPGAGDIPRHPSQLYEAALEGALLFALLWLLATRRGWLKRPGLVTGLFFIGYGAARAFVELFREPDALFFGPGNPYGHAIRFTAEYGLTMGQVLSLPMILIGFGLWAFTRRR